MHRWLILAPLAGVIASCGGGAGDPGGDGLQQQLAFAEVEAHAFSAVRTPRVAVVNDDAAWAALWAEHTANVFPAPARPAVDFSTQTVAAVFLGEVTDCRRPVVQSVAVTAPDRIRVSYRVDVPVLGSSCPAVITSPVEMVRFSNTARFTVEFQRF